MVQVFGGSVGVSWTLAVRLPIRWVVCDSDCGDVLSSQKPIICRPVMPLVKAPPISRQTFTGLNNRVEWNGQERCMQQDSGRATWVAEPTGGRAPCSSCSFRLSQILQPSFCFLCLSISVSLRRLRAKAVRFDWLFPHGALIGLLV